MTLFLMLDPALGRRSTTPGIVRPRPTACAATGARDPRGSLPRGRPRRGAPRLWSRSPPTRVFRIPAIRLAEAQARHGARRTSYLFTWATPVVRRHARVHARARDPVRVRQPRPARRRRSSPATAPSAQALADAMHEAWIRFAPDRRPGLARLRSRPARDADLRRRGPPRGRRPGRRRAERLGKHRPHRVTRSRSPQPGPGATTVPAFVASAAARQRRSAASLRSWPA